MSITFAKMNGAGNEFVVLDAVRQEIILSKEMIAQLADPAGQGKGCDQILLVEPPQQDNGSDFFYRIYNADGTEAENCGNGARCLADFIYRKKLSAKPKIILDTLGGLLEVKAIADGYSTTTPIPQFDSDNHWLVDTSGILELEGCEYTYTAVDVGNPHAVIFVEDAASFILKDPLAITKHPYFSQGVNLGIAQIKDKHKIILRVIERGVGETQACGSGAVAAAVAGITQDIFTSPIEIQMLGGVLQVLWDKSSAPQLIGSVEFEFEAIFEDDA